MSMVSSDLFTDIWQNQKFVKILCKETLQREDVKRALQNNFLFLNSKKKTLKKAMSKSDTD